MRVLGRGGRGGDEVVRPAAVQAALAQHDGVAACAVVLVHGPGHDALRDDDAAEHRTALVVHLHDVARRKSQLARVHGVHPYRLVLVAVGARHLAGLDLAEPGDVVMLRVHAEVRVVRDKQEGVLPPALQVLALLVAGALVDPVRDGPALAVVGEVVRERG